MRRTLVMLLVLTSVAFGQPSGGSSASADAVKAAYLYKIIRYTRIVRETAGQEYVMGVFSGDRVARVLADTMDGKAFGGVRIRLVRLKEGDSVEACDFVYVEDGYWKGLEKGAVSDVRSPLVVGEGGSFLERGGDVALVLTGEGGISFILDRRNGARKGFNFTAYLLKEASAVVQ